MYQYLQCSFEDFKLTDNILNYAEVESEINKTCGGTNSCNCCKVYINGRLYQCNLILNEANVQFNIIRKLWRQIEDIVLTEISNPNFNAFCARAHIVDFLSLCRHAISTNNGKIKEVMILKLLANLDLLKVSISCLHKLEDYAISKLVPSSVQCANNPASIYFHTYFDMRYLILSIETICNRPLDILKETFTETMKDLLYLAYKFYIKFNLSIVTEKHPFICRCTQRLWIILFKLAEKIFNSRDTFWKVYNYILESYDEVFCFWAIKYTAALQFYDDHGIFNPDKQNIVDNTEHVDAKLKMLLKNIENDSNKLKISLLFLQPLLNNYWLNLVKIEPYQVLWEHFYKNLNTLEAKIPKCTASLSEHIENISRGLQKSTYTCFDLYLHMLLVHLTTHPSHWSKLRGRVYSRLSPNKLKDLNETGRYNISLLFLVLSSFNFEEMQNKLKDILECFINDKKHSELLWIINMTVITTFIKAGRTIDIPISKPLLNLVDHAANNRDQFYLIKLFTEGLDHIINISNNYSLNQFILFGGWLNRYMQSCLYSDLCFLLNLLTWTAENVYRHGVWFEWSHIFTSNILPGLKQISMSPNAPPQTGKLAALILRNSPDAVVQHLSYFVGEGINYKVLNQFLSTLLEDYPENRLFTPSQEHTIIQAWVRCSLLNTDNIDQLSEKILKFSTFALLGINNTTQERFLNLIKTLGVQYVNNVRVVQLKEICEICFGNIDRSISSFLTNPQSEASVTLLFTNTSYLFFHCSSLLYNKTKSNCLLSKLVNVLLLPKEVLMGKSPNALVLRAVEKTWHLFFEGIFSASCSLDLFLERILKDLTIRYVPFFTPSLSPFIKCVDNLQYMTFILEKIAVQFVNQSAKSSEENCFKALKTIQILLEKLHDVNILKAVLPKVLPGVLEVIMFQNQKHTALEIVKVLALSPFYVDIRDTLKHAILIVTEKHLAFSSNNYFQMATTLTKLVPLEMKDLLPDIKKQIVIVERMRGVGYDNILRQYLDRFESTLASS